MKNKKYCTKLLIIFCFTLGIKYAGAQCSSNFVFFIGPNGQMTFSSTASPITPTSYYSWSFVNSSLTSTGNGTNFAIAGMTYSANGTYDVVLTYSNSAPPCALSVTGQTFNVNNVMCTINADFTVSPIAPGTYNFINTTTGANASTTYSWNYGDGSPETYGISGSHTYSNNATYPVRLIARNTGSANCIDTNIVNVTVTSLTPCALVASYNAVSSLTTAGKVDFSNTSSGNTAATSYTLRYGDGIAPSGTNFLTLSHTYLSNGAYTTTLILQNNPTCTASAIQTVQVSNIPITCSLNANFTHTVGASGLVNFSGVTSGNSTGPFNYFWDFGDGVYSTLQSPAHTYMFAGAYNVMFRASDTISGQCRDSVIYALNITGLPCSANAGFNLSPSGVPQYWNAVPLFPWNVTTARWDWGDGTYTDSLYTSHTYPAAGSYSICLSVTVSCGSTASICSTYAVFKTTNPQQEMAIVHINVKKPSLTNGIANFAGNDENFDIYPNPNNGEFNLLATGLKTSEVNICIYNLVGELVYTAQSPVISGSPLTVQPGAISNGVYFVALRSGDRLLTKKIIVSKQ